MTDVAVRGTELEVRDEGEGRPLVLVHGSANDLRMWGPQVERWRDGFRVVAYSRRHHWPNEPITPGGTYALDDHVEDLRALLEALEAEPATLVGHSYGGLVSLLLAARSPRAVEGLVLIEPPVMGFLASVPPGPGELLGLALRHPRTALGILKLGARGFGPAEAALARGDEEEALRRMGIAVLGEEAYRKVEPDRMEQFRDNLIPEELQSEEALPRLDPDLLASIRCPSLLVGGGRSPAVFARLLDRLEEMLPEAERVTVPGASHLVQEDRPEPFHEAVEAFLERCAAADRAAPSSSPGEPQQ